MPSPLAVALLALAGACNNDGTGPSGGAPGSELLFVAYPDTASAYANVNAALYLANADGSGRHQVVTRPGEKIDVARWAPDGQRIAFMVTGGPSGDVRYARLYVVNRDQSGLVKIAEGVASGVSLAWSPDGQRIAYGIGHATPLPSGGLSYTSSLHVVDASGANDRVVADGTAGPSWSPDGRRIAFVRRTPITHEWPAPGGSVVQFVVNVPALWVVSADTADARMIAHVESPTCNDYPYNFCEAVVTPHWSPNGGRIAFHSYVTGHSSNGSGSVWLINPDGTQLQQLSACSASDNRPGAPVWSPDGTRIAYGSGPTSFGSPDAGSAIYVRDANGGGCRRLTPPVSGTMQSNVSPSWSPDGARIAFVRSTNADLAASGVFIMNADGTGLRRLVSDREAPGASAVQWNPASSAVP